VIVWGDWQPPRRYLYPDANWLNWSAFRQKPRTGGLDGGFGSASGFYMLVSILDSLSPDVSVCQ